MGARNTPTAVGAKRKHSASGRVLEGHAAGGERRRTTGILAIVAQRTELARTLSDVARIANLARTVEGAAEAMLERVCEGLGWCAGHLYLDSADQTGLLDVGVWWAHAPRRFARVRKVLREMEWTPTAALAGQALSEGRVRSYRPAEASHEPAWWPVARAAGLTSAVAFPVLVGERPVGVLEFFDDGAGNQGDELLPVVAQIGAQLGGVVERAALDKSLARIAEEERRRVGQDLHETVGQDLAVAGLAAAALRDRLTLQGRPEADQAVQLAKTIEVAKSHVRSLARGLALEFPQTADLPLSLARLAEGVSVGGVSCRVEGGDAFPVESEVHATQLLRIAHEAVNNALLHGKARNVLIRLTASRRSRRLEIHDDGSGLPSGSQRHAGLGTRIMRYRAGLIGGRLLVESPKGRGTVVTCVLSPRCARTE